jgi:hypothetical protein
MTKEQFEKADDLLSTIASLKKTIEDIEEFLKEEGKFYMDLTLIHPVTSGKNNERAEDFYVPREDLVSIFLPYLRKRLTEKEKQFAEL